MIRRWWYRMCGRTCYELPSELVALHFARHPTPEMKQKAATL